MLGKDCFDINSAIEDSILRKLKKNDLVLISVFSIGNKFIYRHKYDGIYDLFTDFRNNPLTQDEAIKKYFDDLIIFINKVSDKGGKIIFYLHGPRFDEVGFGKKCLGINDWNTQWFNLSDPNSLKCHFSVKKFKNQVRSPLEKGINKIKSNKDVLLLDALDGEACDENYCDGSYYKDPHHMYDFYASFFIKEFLKNKFSNFIDF